MGQLTIISKDKIVIPRYDKLPRELGLVEEPAQFGFPLASTRRSIEIYRYLDAHAQKRTTNLKDVSRDPLPVWFAWTPYLCT